MRIHYRPSRVLAAVVIGGIALAANAAPVNFDLSNSFTSSTGYDAWIGPTEYTYTHWVGSTFGDHSLCGGNSRTYAWQDQVPSGETGLPMDGRVTVDVGGTIWPYQLMTQREDVPAGGYSSGNTPKALNMFQHHSEGWSLYSGWSEKSLDLPSAEQGMYEAINFLFTSEPSPDGEKAMRIIARYDDGSDELIYRDPPSGFAGDGGIEARWNQSTPDSGDCMQAYHTTANYSQGGSDIFIRDDVHAYMHTFASPLVVDPSKILTGLDIGVYNSANNRTTNINIFAATGLPVPEPATLGLFALAAFVLTSRRGR